MARDRELKVIISGDSSSLSRAFKDSARSGSKFTSGLKTLGKVAAAGVGAAFAGLAVTLKKGFDEVAEGQQVLAQTNAVLKSTGGTANVTAKEVAGLATELSNLTGVDDEAVQATENLLLTFTSIRNEAGKGNDIFNQTTSAVLDMATAMNNGAVPSLEQLNSQTIRVGKALNDPIKGMTALSRVGVSFTAGQKETIKSLVESGDVMAAQKLILAELTKEFGGSAQAAGETLPGQLAKLQNSFSEVAGEIFTTLLPYLMQFLDWVNRNMPTIQRVIQTTLNAVVATIQFLGPIIGRLIEFFRQVADAAQRYWPAVQRAAQTVIAYYRQNIAPAIENILAAITAFWRKFGDDITNIVRRSLGVLKNVIMPILGNIASVIQAIMAVIRGDWGTAWKEISEIPGRTLRGAIAVIRGMAGIFFAAAKAIGAAIVEGIVAGVTGIGSAIANKLKSGIQGAIDDVKATFDIFSPSGVTEREIGKPIADGVVLGWEKGSKSLGPKMAEAIQAAMETARAAVEEKKGIFEGAFSELTNSALSAFDRLSDEFLTKTEKKIQAQDARRAAQERQGALATAKAGLAEAQAGGDPQAILDAQKQVDDALFAIQRAADEKRAAQERIAYEQQRERQRVALEQRLANLQNNFLQGELTVAQFTKRMTTILDKAGIPLQASAEKLGFALATGLRAAKKDAVRAAQELAREIVNQLGNISVSVRVHVARTDAPDADKRAQGGPVTKGRQYLIGEKGPELFIPHQSGQIISNADLNRTSSMTPAGGGNTIVFNFPNYLGDRSELTRAIQEADVQWQRANGGRVI